MLQKKNRFALAAVLIGALLALTGVVEPAPIAVAGTQVDGMVVLAAIGGLGMLDVFKGDAFGVLKLTDAINNIPFVPGRAGMLIPWNEEGVPTTTIAIEEISGTLTLVSPTARGGPGSTVGKEKRKIRNLSVPHFQVDDAIYAEEVQGVRAFGQESQLQTVQNVVDARLQSHVLLRLDPTIEYQRIGAVKGVITYADGTTLDLFSEFGVSQETEVDFDLDNATPASGALRKKCAEVSRLVADNMQMQPYVGLHAFCGNAFFDDLLAHKEVVASYANTDMASVLRAGYVYPNGQKVYGAFEFGGIVWENYRGKVGATSFVHTDKAHIFPMGSPGLFRTVYAPADYIETVNTNGLPRYAKQYAMPNDKGVHLEVQTNPLSYCTRPKSLILGKRT